MLSTATMVRLGYVTGNRMTNVLTRNAKLRARAINILMAENNLDSAAAEQALKVADGDLPVALVMSKTGCTLEEAGRVLGETNRIVSEAIVRVRSKHSPK